MSEERGARVSAIAAIGAKTRALGKGNDLLWEIPADLKRFKEMTVGHPIIMGRKTYDSIGHPLPKRTNIIVTRDPEFKAEACIVVNSLEKAFAYSHELENRKSTGEVFVIGGGEIYTQALPYTDRLYLTLVEDNRADADTFFPDYSEFTKTISEEKGEHQGLTFTWVTLEKESDSSF